MLVLQRYLNEQIVIGDGITIEVIDIRRVRGEQGRLCVRLGITAPRGVRVDRKEVRERIEREGARVASLTVAPDGPGKPCPDCGATNTVEVAAVAAHSRCLHCGNAWED